MCSSDLVKITCSSVLGSGLPWLEPVSRGFSWGGGMSETPGLFISFADISSVFVPFCLLVYRAAVFNSTFLLFVLLHPKSY